MEMGFRVTECLEDQLTISTMVPMSAIWKNVRACSSGKRMQPWDAG
jgi:hypothetical protein